jgi:acetyl-CoA carboxylase carboxyltransferase component
MGGAAKVARQHERGKLTCRERLERFFDDGAYFELGLHGSQADYQSPEAPPADAVVCGWGKVDGRPVAAAAYDFTVKGGSIGMVGETKVTRLRELSLRCRMPMVWFVDSAGARIEPTGEAGAFISQFAGTGHLFREEVLMSGVVPLVAAMVGPGAAGTAYIPGLADFVPMVEGVGSMALGGPPLVKAVTGQDVDEQELGGSKVHTEKSGVGDLEVPDEAACIAVIKDYLSYLPSHCEERPPIAACTDPIDRREERLLGLLPESTRQPYDMYALLTAIVDGGRLLDIKPRWARSIITCLARLGGRPVGIVANNPKQLGGILTIDAADKAARFIQICDAFGLSLVFLMDVPGFMVGTQVEHAGIIRHGAKMLHVMASATVPKLTVVVRKGYGAGYYVMAGRAYEPDLLVAWPGAEISVMGAEGMVGIAQRKIFGDEPPSPEARRALTEQIQKTIDIQRVAGLGLVDDIIDPRDTRPLLCRAVEMSWNRRVERPWRRRAIMPV